ncbi:MAG: hypothetical protein U9O49_01755 [Candidatus Thermoplasmatota archaeon]|nr:hypothetical protein [Candidatus Thermoplasmatota archaeon]
MKIFAEKIPAFRNFLLNKGIINNDQELPEENTQIDDPLETVPPTGNKNAQENNNMTPEDNTPIEEDLVLVWDFGDGSTGTGMYPMHTYETVLLEDSMPDVADSYNSFSPIGIPYKDNPNIVIPSEEDDKDDTINKNVKTITYTVTLYIVLDKDDIIKDENDINLKLLEILDSDTTEITIELQSYTNVNEEEDGVINNGDSDPVKGILDIDKKTRLEIF